MERILIRERYKVIQVLYAQENYAVLQAVDIRSREKSLCLLNVYEGAYLKPYLCCFHDLRSCPSYREMFVWEGSLVAVFDCREGVSIDQIFYQGAKVDWGFRLEAAQALFHQALTMWDFPPRISCPALMSENVRFFQEERLLMVNYAVYPLGELDRRELVFLLSDQIRKVLMHRWDSPLEERRFVRELCAGGERSAVGAYGKWIAAEPVIRSAYERMDRKSTLGRWLHLLWINLRDWVEIRIKKGRRGWGQ